MKIKYNDNENFIAIEKYEDISSNIVRIIGQNLTQNTSGFSVYFDEDIIEQEANEVDNLPEIKVPNLLWDYSEYTVVYDQGDDYIDYTSDKNIYNVFYVYNEYGYIVDVLSTTEDSVQNGILFDKGQGIKYVYPYLYVRLTDNDGIYNYKMVDDQVAELSNEEKSILLNETQNDELQNIKDYKISDSKYFLSEYLKNHPLISSCHGDTKAKYNATLEKQNLMVNRYMTYTFEKNIGLNPTLRWNAAGEELEEWTEEEFVQLILEIKNYVEPLVLKQQEYEKQIKKCRTIEELDGMNINYEC